MFLHMQGKEQMNFIKNKSWMILKILENENEIVPCQHFPVYIGNSPEFQNAIRKKI